MRKGYDLKTTCLWYALDRWAEVGGRLGLVRSTHWCIPHVQHHTIDEQLTQFVPLSDLRAPWHSLFGFEGHVVTLDANALQRGPVNPICMFIGTCILLVAGGAWFFHRQYKALKCKFT